MITEAGPRVLEFNARFGDPECQAVVRRIASDLLPILLACADGKLESIEPPEWDPRVCVGVVAAAEGYPGPVRKGDPIDGLLAAEEVPEVVVFHGGTAFSREGEVVTAGGRVLCITALGADLDEARARAYEAYDRIRWQGKFCRRDIGVRDRARRARVREVANGSGGAGEGASPGQHGGPRPRRAAP
jgi:phosphoribosylamine--glycine ligase